MFQILLIYIVAYTRFLDLLKDWERVIVQLLATLLDCALFLWLFLQAWKILL